ncbi:MAG: hypothetical protein AAB909_01500 [Patescibacteria group bacterium]
MSKLFYDSLTDHQDLIDSLDLPLVSEDERAELINLIDEIMSHNILNVILNHLPKNHHEEFIKKLHSAPHDPELLVYLQERTEVDIVVEIKNHAERIKKDIASDIHKSRTKR